MKILPVGLRARRGHRNRKSCPENRKAPARDAGNAERGDPGGERGVRREGNGAIQG